MNCNSMPNCLSLSLREVMLRKAQSYPIPARLPRAVELWALTLATQPHFVSHNDSRNLNIWAALPICVIQIVKNILYHHY